MSAQSSMDDERVVELLPLPLSLTAQDSLSASRRPGVLSAHCLDNMGCAVDIPCEFYSSLREVNLRVLWSGRSSFSEGETRPIDLSRVEGAGKTCSVRRNRFHFIYCSVSICVFRAGKNGTPMLGMMNGGPFLLAWERLVWLSCSLGLE